jgi:hypothetical protein
LSSKTDHPDGPNTLPEPELNPLLNPILGQHMGRWAEVYFTSPPERREQAVLELLHELQGENATPEGTTAIPTTSAQEETVEPVSERASEIPQTPVGTVRCHSCGRQNPASHRFCGMCGFPLGKQAAEPGVQVADPRTDDSAPHTQADETAFSGRQEAVYEPALRTNELSLLQGLEPSYRDDHEDDMFSHSALRSYRVYIGIALAITIFGLAYMAWRSVQATSLGANLAPQVPRAIMRPAVPTPAPLSASKTDTQDGTAPANQKAVAPPQPVHSRQDSRTGDDKSADDTPPTAAVAEAKPPEASVIGNGAEEFAIAQHYLTGGAGLQRNPAEAAKWLWKSMAKHNANATLLLADLYLKGDGVSKNCDQARVLLDSAARSGMKEAGDRLRHLQSFGCE